jgi:hypothetical protein
MNEPRGGVTFASPIRQRIANNTRHRQEATWRETARKDATTALDPEDRRSRYFWKRETECARAVSAAHVRTPVRSRPLDHRRCKCFLLARRLVEAGVRLVTFVWYYICKDGNVANVWDNHGGTGSLGGITGYEMLKAPYCLPTLDQGFSALLEDLAQREMLGETLVTMLGEFGRTPKINPQVGRDHWGPCRSVVLAGGGVRGGQVYGASDKIAAYPTERAVRPEVLIATVYRALGINPEELLRDQTNRPHRVCEGNPVLELFA